MVVHYLEKVTYAKVIRFVNRSGSRTLKPADELHYGRLAGTVLPDEPDLVVLADMEINAVQQGEPTVGNCQTVDGYHSPYPLSGESSSSGLGLQQSTLAS